MPDEFDEYGDEISVSTDLGGLQAELRTAQRQLDQDELAMQQAEADWNRISRAIEAKTRPASDLDAADTAILTADRRLQRSQKQADRLESQVLQARRQLATKSTGTTTKEINGTLFERQPNGQWREVARDPFLDADRKFKEEEARIRNALAAQRISLDQAKQMLDAENQRLQREATAEYQRSQIATTKRGQDLTYASTQRGQNMNYASNLAQTGSDAMMRSLPYLAPEGTNADLANAINSIGSGKPVNVQPRSMQFPFNPTDIGTQIAAMVLRNISPTAAQVADGGPVPTAETAPQVSSDAQAALGAGSQGFTVPPVQSQGKPGFVAPSLGSNFSSGNRMRPI